MGTDQITLVDPAELRLDAETSKALIGAMRELFESAGWRLEWGAETRWYTSHPSLQALPAASIDRAIGRSIDPWLPKGLPARPIRALQNEMQMLLYGLKLNDDRIAAGQLPVNSFWISGCGPRQVALPTPDLVLATGLRAPALAEDWAEWADAWRALDAGPVAELARRAEAGKPSTLTLCGERNAQRHEAVPMSFMARIGRRFTTLDPAPILESL